jgi:transcriptional regulator with XRE-family HTH domain
MATKRLEERRLVGALLRRIRLASGLRQQDIAARLHVPQSFVGKYESGERYLGVMELRAICRALGVSLASFVEMLEAQIDDDDAQPGA